MLSISVLICGISILALAQRRKGDNQKRTDHWGLSHYTKIPVVYGSKVDGLPDYLKVQGTITEVSLSPIACGFIEWAGTLKIRLANKIDGYPHEDIFVIATCFIGDDKSKYMYLNKIVSLELVKLHDKTEERPPFDLVANTIDSEGVPFYWTGLGPDDIQRVIEKENLLRPCQGKYRLGDPPTCAYCCQMIDPPTCNPGNRWTEEGTLKSSLTIEAELDAAATEALKLASQPKDLGSSESGDLSVGIVTVARAPDKKSGRRE